MKMDSLTDLCAKSIIKDQKLLEITCVAKDIIKDNLFVFVPLQKYKSRYNNFVTYKFLFSAFSSYQKAQECLQKNNIDGIIQKVPLDPRYKCDRVYVLVNYFDFPHIITNNFELYIYNLNTFEGYYFQAIGDDSIEDNALLIDDMSFLYIG